MSMPSGLARCALATCVLVWPVQARCQTAATADDQSGTAAPSEPRPTSGEVVVVGHRGQVSIGIEPLATYNADAFAAMGATSTDELLRAIRGVTQSADGQEPVFLLNAQRVSGYQDIGNLPPEAVDKVEVLPEPAALRFGYPPTRRVVNFITKRRFRQLGFKLALGTSTRGGADNGNAHVDLTRLHDDARLTFSFDARHTDALLQSRRHVLPDPDLPFDAVGNVTGTLPGGEIDPALSALAGQPVTIAPVPIGARTLPGFAASANMPRLFDLSPLHALAPATDTLHGEAVVANRIGGTLAGSLTLTADRSRQVTLYGPASVTFRVPAANPFSPFTTDVLLQRYLVEAAPVGQRLNTTTLHAGGVLRGAWRRWQWDLTGTLDLQRRGAVTQTGIDPAAGNAALAAGAAPFRPFAPAFLANRLVDRSVQVTRGAGAKFVLTGRQFNVPAGPVNVTGTVEAEHTDADATTRGADGYEIAFGRARVEGAISIDVPLASRREAFLPWAGEVSANASAAIRRVGGFGTLTDTTLGLSWAPIPGVQLLAQVKRSAAAPMLDQLSGPQVSAPQVPLFDFATGHSTLVRVLYGGNPALAAERRHVRSISAMIKPFAHRELRLGATYEVTEIGNGIQTLYAVTPFAQAALPDLFVQNATGVLASVSFRPINVDRERQRALNLTLATSGHLGASKPPVAPGGQPAERPSFYGGLGPTLRFADRVRLRPGIAELNLLAGDTLSGGTTQRLAGYGYGGINYLGNGATFDFYCTGAASIRGAVPAAILDFSPVCRINATGSLSLHHFFRRHAWTRHLGLKLEVGNVTDVHQHVRDATGAVPYRYQPDLLDPVGRTITVSVRKLF